MTLPKIRVAGGALGRDTSIYIDSFRVPGLSEFTLYINSHEVTKAIIEITVGEVQVDAEALVSLIGNYEESKGVSKLP